MTRDMRTAPPLKSGRDIALNGLMDVDGDDAYSGLALNQRLRDSNATPLEKRFATELFYGTLENLMYIDYVLSKYITVQPQMLLKNILRIAAYQMLFLTRVPASAACDEAVKQARRGGFESATGFVNALTRGLSRDKDAGTLKLPDPSDRVAYLSVMHSMPEDIVNMLLDSYDDAFVEAILAYRQDERGVSVYANPMRFTDAEFERWLTDQRIEFQKSDVEGVYKLVGGGDVAGHPGYRDGLFSILGEASMLAARELNGKNGMHILDTCAAPGGKTAYLAQKMQGTGRVHAWDIHEHRIELIRATAKRLNLENIRPALRDARKVYENCIDMLDAVLIDAPCSGLGVMLNKPDVKYRVTREGVAELVKTQAAILEASARYVKRGALLVYSTCTILPDENQRQIERFLAAHDEFTLEHSRQLFSHVDHTDGFYIARMRRKK